MKYERIPTVIEAVQWDGTIEAFKAIEALYETEVFTVKSANTHAVLLAGPDGISGWVNVPVGTWVAFDGVNDFWPVADDHFTATYQEVQQ